MTLDNFMHTYNVKPKYFADKLGITPAHVSLLRNGGSLPSLPLAIKIEEATVGQVTTHDWPTQTLLASDPEGVN